MAKQNLPSIYEVARIDICGKACKMTMKGFRTKSQAEAYRRDLGKDLEVRGYDRIDGEEIEAPEQIFEWNTQQSFALVAVDSDIVLCKLILRLTGIRA